MAATTGFQANTTIHAAFWIYKPDPAVDPVGREVIVQVNNIQKIESTQDHNTVWIYYAMTDVSTSQRAEILNGPVAQAFMSDLEALF
jgi:hypothetical protein